MLAAAKNVLIQRKTPIAVAETRRGWLGAAGGKGYLHLPPAQLS